MNHEAHLPKETHQYLKEVKDLLDFIHKYPKAMKELHWEDLIKADEVDAVYEEWLWLLERLTDYEADFYQPTWIPIMKTNLNMFIDFSHPDKPIFETMTSVSERREYQQIFMFKKVNILRFMLEFDVNMKKYYERFKIFIIACDFESPDFPEFSKFPNVNLFKRLGS
jgi:hypothetical protein